MASSHCFSCLVRGTQENTLSPLPHFEFGHEPGGSPAGCCTSHHGLGGHEVPFPSCPLSETKPRSPRILATSTEFTPFIRSTPQCLWCITDVIGVYLWNMGPHLDVTLPRPPFWQWKLVCIYGSWKCLKDHEFEGGPYICHLFLLKPKGVATVEYVNWGIIEDLRSGLCKISTLP